MKLRGFLVGIVIPVGFSSAVSAATAAAVSVVTGCNVYSDNKNYCSQTKYATAAASTKTDFSTIKTVLSNQPQQPRRIFASLPKQQQQHQSFGPNFQFTSATGINDMSLSLRYNAHGRQQSRESLSIPTSSTATTITSADHQLQHRHVATKESISNDSHDYHDNYHPLHHNREQTEGSTRSLLSLLSPLMLLRGGGTTTTPMPTTATLGSSSGTITTAKGSSSLLSLALKKDKESPQQQKGRRPSSSGSSGDLADSAAGELEAFLEITGGEQSPPDDGSTVGSGGATIGASIFNLVNNVAGAGILALPAGKAAGTGWIPSLLICAALGALNARTFCMIGEACELTNEKDFKGLWARTLGKNTTYLVDSMIAVLCLACLVIYSGILGDVFTPLLREAGLADAYNGRTSNILIVTVLALLPMSLIKDLSVLAFTSIFGFTAIIYTVVFVVIRALDGSYQLDSGRFVTGEDALELLPSFAKSSLFHTDFTSLVLVSNLGLAYVSHYNGPTFYRQLKNPNSKRFSILTNSAFCILVVLYQTIMAAGYYTFGDVSQGNILLNYHPKDMLARFGRVATGCSILFGFPLVSTGARESLSGVAASFGMPVNNTWLVLGILAFVTSISCTVSDVSLVVSLTGAAMGSFICYICPALLYTRSVELVKGPDSVEYSKAKWNLALVPFGLVMGAFGVFMTLKGAGTE